MQKKYYRKHIAYLIMICSLKQSFNIATLQHMIPVGIAEEEVKAIYQRYAHQHHEAAQYFVRMVKEMATPVLNPEKDFTGEKTDELVSLAAIIAGFAKLLTEKLILLHGHTLETQPIDAPTVAKAPEKESM